jgi:hypothetical protein
MTTRQLRNSINRSAFRRGFVLIPLLLACVALSPSASAQAISTKWTQIGSGIQIRSEDVGTHNAYNKCGRIVQAAWRIDDADIQDRHILWMGTAFGGLWKSKVDSSGDIKKWIPLTENFPGPHAMGSFLVHRSGGNRILIGPGGFSTGRDIGDGKIYRTNDQGGTWYGHLLPVSTGEKAPGRINRIVEDRSDPTGNTVFACTSHGIYRSTEFGEANSWVRVYPFHLGTVSPIEVTDIVQDTGNPKIWYAGALIDHAILRSTDGGLLWQSWDDAYPKGSDAITGTIGRVSLAACVASPNVLYALVAQEKGDTTDGDLNGLYRSLNRGKSWTAILKYDPDNKKINPLSQALHTCAIACDPNYAGHIIVGMENPPLETFNATNLVPALINWREVDGGHGDYNFFLFRSGFSNIVIANDGGYYIYDPYAQTLDDSGNLLGIEANFLRADQGALASSWSEPSLFLGGLEDNGVVQGDASANTLTWIADGDGGQVSIFPSAASVITGKAFEASRRSVSFNSGKIWFDISLGLDDNKFSTVQIDPTPGVSSPKIFTFSQPDPDVATSVVYYRHFKDTDHPWQRASVDSIFAVLPGLATHLDHTTNPNRHDFAVTLERDHRLFVYTGKRSELGSLVLVDRSPPLTTDSSADDAHVNADKSASQPNTIYYTTGTARPSQAFMSVDCGQTWLEMTKHLGEIPADADFNKLIRNPLNQRQFFLATSKGVYTRDPVTHEWKEFSEGLRIKEDVQDIVINTHNLAVPTLYIATKGRGFWQRAIP